jgi:hypothetical protein
MHEIDKVVGATKYSQPNEQWRGECIASGNFAASFAKGCHPPKATSLKFVDCAH